MSPERIENYRSFIAPAGSLNKTTRMGLFKIHAIIKETSPDSVFLSCDHKLERFESPKGIILEITYAKDCRYLQTIVEKWHFWLKNMRMANNSFFATLIEHKRLMKPQSQLHKDLLRESKITAQIDQDGISWSRKHYPYGYTSYASWNDLHLRFTSFSDLQKQIDRKVNLFAKKLHWDLMGGVLKMSNLWINVMNKGASHSGHIHPLSVISGTYYLKTPAASSEIRFEDPRLPMMLSSPPRLHTAPKELSWHCGLNPKAGDLILFESWLRHEIPVYLGDSERISLSFNYEWSEKNNRF